MSKLLINFAPIEIKAAANVAIGVQPYDETTLRTLRQEHQATHFFQRGGDNGNSIYSVALKTNLEPLGKEIGEQQLTDAPWLLAPLTITALLSFFTALGRPVLKRRPLRILSANPPNIFPRDSNLPDWIQRRIILDFDTRIIRDTGHNSRPMLACGVRTRNFINASCDALHQAGVPLIGRYVAAQRAGDDPRIQGYLALAGCVTGCEGTVLTLTDHGDGPSTINASEAFLEPRKENLVWCVRHLLGKNADRVLAKADDIAVECLSGPERLKLIRRTFDYLRKQSIELAPGVPLVLGPLSGDTQGKLPFRSEIIPKPHLVFDPSGTRTDRWNERGLDNNGPYDQRTFSPKQLHIAVVCQPQCEGQVEAFLAKFLDGLPDVTIGSDEKARAPYAKGFIRRYALEAPKVRTFTTQGASVQDYTTACRNAIEAATDGRFEWSLAIVQIDQDFKELSGSDNPYFATKAMFLKQRIPVQEITLETMRFSDQQLVFALNNMSIASYAKIGGIPWLLKSQPIVAHELVVGIGSHTFSESRLGSHERVVGITTIFSSDGKYLLDDRTAAVPYDQYEQVLFSSLARSIDAVRRNDNWRSTDDVRLIFHGFKQMANREAEAVGKLVESLGLTQVKFAFLHLVDDHPFLIFDENNSGVRQKRELKGVYAPERGLAIRLGDTETLLSFKGSREVKQARDGIPQPTLLRLHPLSTFRDMTYLTRQAFEFSCHSWRMFTPAPLPITIHYSELIAHLLTGYGTFQLGIRTRC